MELLNRRELVKLAAAALAAAQVACSQEGALAPKDSSDEAYEGNAKSLGYLAHDLFPHDSVLNEKYVAIATYFVSQSPDVATSLVAKLTPADLAFEESASSERHALIEEHFFSPELQAFRLGVIIGLYDDLNVTQNFGYQGPSVNEGGYINRGFNDLDWLPEPK